MKVTTKKSAGSYIRAATALLRGKLPAEAISISALGNAINVAVVVAARIEQNGLAQISRIRTEYPEMPNGPRCCQIIVEMLGSSRLKTLLQGRRVALIRHGNTGKAEVDSDRQLTDKGRTQCEQFRDAWSAVLVGVTTVFASPVKRTMETARLLVSSTGLTVTPVEDLYFVRPWRTDAMKAADEDCGYAPIGMYIEKYPGSHAPAGSRMAAVAVAGSGMPDGDVLMVGHAGYLSFLALEVLEAAAPIGSEREQWLDAGRKVVLNANVGEVCGFEVSPAGVRYLPNPESTDFAAAKSNDAFIGKS